MTPDIDTVRINEWSAQTDYMNATQQLLAAYEKKWYFLFFWFRLLEINRFQTIRQANSSGRQFSWSMF